MCDMAAYSNAIRISASSDDSSMSLSQLPIVHLHFVKQAGIQPGTCNCLYMQAWDNRFPGTCCI